MKNNQPLVSIGMPVYDRLEPTRRAINSILNQSYKNLEIIISNDCSPLPDMYKMLDEFAAKDPRIKLFHQKVDLQCYGNYYFVQHQATGKYFMYGQDDDWWDEDYIKKLVDNLEKNTDNAFALAHSFYVTPDGKKWQEFRFDNQNVISFIFGEKNPFVWMGLWRTDLIRQFDYTRDEQHGKDIIIAAEVLLSYPFGYVDNTTYYKTIYHEKARKYIAADRFCHFKMYSSLLYRVATSKYVKRKYLLVVMIPAAMVGIVRLYTASLLFKLPVDHPIRNFVRRIARSF